VSLADRLDGRTRVRRVGERPFPARTHLRPDVLEPREIELALRGEVAVEDRLGDARGASDLGGRRAVVAPLGEQADCRLDEVLPALDRIATTLIDFSRRSVEAGAAGIFYAVSGYASEDLLSAEEYDRWLAPLDQRVLESLPEDAILAELPADAIVTEPMQLAAAAVEPEEAPLPAVAWDDVPEPPPPPAREESPLDFKQALQALAGVSDRDSIAHIVLRASRSKAARALLLQVQGGVALGWDGLGEGTENAHQVAMPLAAESAFSLVVKTRSHYMGPLQKTPANIRFLATLGKKVPLSALIFPILHRGRVSHMLYLDNGHKKQAPTDMGEMLILTQRIGQTVEALVERKRKATR